MQTFLPHADFTASARVLDQRRLGKQRVEALQILNALTVPGNGWRHHPAVHMWRGYEEALGRYALEICLEWCGRGYTDTCATKIEEALRERLGIAYVRSQAELAAVGALPPWLGDEALHASHRSALVRKEPATYADRFDDVPDDLEYVWPVRGGA